MDDDKTREMIREDERRLLREPSACVHDYEDGDYCVKCGAMHPAAYERNVYSTLLEPTDQIDKTDVDFYTSEAYRQLFPNKVVKYS